MAALVQITGRFVWGNDLFEKALPGPTILDDFWGMTATFRMNFQSLKNPTKPSGSNQGRVGQVKIDTNVGSCLHFVVKAMPRSF